MPGWPSLLGGRQGKQSAEPTTRSAKGPLTSKAIWKNMSLQPGWQSMRCLLYTSPSPRDSTSS
eukprot:1750492-Prorocentrum_lima.AAC.1